MNPESEQWKERVDRPGLLNVLGVFLTVDGEATAFHVGTWTVFVRLTGCRVGCRWCDTKYSWSIKQGELVTPDELWKVVKRMLNGATKISITGGEPLEQDGPMLRAFVAYVLNEGLRVSMETSGTEPFYGEGGFLWDVQPLANTDRLCMVVDYKLHAAHAIKPFLWPNYNAMRAHDIIKFVVADDNDYNEMISIARHMHHVSKVTWKRDYMPRLVASPVITDTPGSSSSMTAWRLAEKLKVDPYPVARSIGMNLQLHKYVWTEDARDEEEG